MTWAVLTVDLTTGQFVSAVTQTTECRLGQIPALTVAMTAAVFAGLLVAETETVTVAAAAAAAAAAVPALLAMAAGQDFVQNLRSFADPTTALLLCLEGLHRLQPSQQQTGTVAECLMSCWTAD